MNKKKRGESIGRLTAMENLHNRQDGPKYAAENVKPPHGVDYACYVNGPGGMLPMIQCLCGKAFRDSSWEKVGRFMDMHIATETGQEIPRRCMYCGRDLAIAPHKHHTLLEGY